MGTQSVNTGKDCLLLYLLDILQVNTSEASIGKCEYLYNFGTLMSIIYCMSDTVNSKI